MEASPGGSSGVALIRHGRSAHVHVGWMSASGFRTWRKAYEAAGIGEAQRIPRHVEHWGKGADVVICSDAPRAIASARLLAPEPKIMISPLFRELDLEEPILGRLRLPLAGWALAVGARALLLRLRRRYPSAVEAARVDDAAAVINELAARHARIVAVTHASFRRLLHARLMQLGWRGSSERSLKHWSAWILTQSPSR